MLVMTVSLQFLHPMDQYTPAQVLLKDTTGLGPIKGGYSTLLPGTQYVLLPEGCATIPEGYVPSWTRYYPPIGWEAEYAY